MRTCVWLMGGLMLASMAVTARADAEVPAVPVAPEPVSVVAPPAAAAAPQPMASPKPAAVAAPADAHDGRCDRCGSCQSVRSVCVPVAVEREKKKVCWSYRCEEICIPGPSILCGEKCGCDECGPWWMLIWKPTCAHVITKHVPVKTEVVRKVPGFEWKVQERCCQCR